MLSSLISFAASALLTLMVIKQVRLHGPALDLDYRGVQKVHAHVVARIGGIPIFISMTISGAICFLPNRRMTPWLMSLMVCASLAFIGGIMEDSTGRVSPLPRLLLTMAAALLACFLVDTRLDRIDFPFGSWRIACPWLALPLTVIAVAGIANAINIIDGFNGLASVVTNCMLLSLAYVTWQVGDVFVLSAALMVAGATAGFLVWNNPIGLVFLGDGGAYFIGFMLDELTLLLVVCNPAVSTWYAVLLLISPAFETLFSTYRRMFLCGKPQYCLKAFICTV